MVIGVDESVTICLAHLTEIMSVINEHTDLSVNIQSQHCAIEVLILNILPALTSFQSCHAAPLCVCTTATKINQRQLIIPMVHKIEVVHSLFQGVDIPNCSTRLFLSNEIITFCRRSMLRIPTNIERESGKKLAKPCVPRKWPLKHVVCGHHYHFLTRTMLYTWLAVHWKTLHSRSAVVCTLPLERDTWLAVWRVLTLTLTLILRLAVHTAGRVYKHFVLTNSNIHFLRYN